MWYEIIEKIVTSGVFLAIVVFRDHAMQDLNDKINDEKNIYRRRSYAFAEETIEGIVTTICIRMRASCPDAPECQLVLYEEIVDNVFHKEIERRIKESIRNNGFLEMTSEQFDAYATEKGRLLFSLAKTYVLRRGVTYLPDLRMFLGTTYSEDEAIADVRMIIQIAMQNTRKAKEAIKKLRKEYNFIKHLLRRS